MKSHNSDEFIDILNVLTADTITFVVAEDQVGLFRGLLFDHLIDFLSFQLSIEDLSQCRTPNGQTCFKGIQEIKSKLYLPSVEDPLSIIDVLGASAGVDMIDLSDGNFRESLDYQTGKYVFINFGDNSKVETKSVKLTRHDRMITTFYNELLLQNQLQITVIFTGKRHQKRVVREIFSPYATDNSNSTNGSSVIEDDDGAIWKTEKALLYYTSMKLEDKWSEIHSMNVTHVTANVFQADTQIIVSVFVNNSYTFEKLDKFKFIITLENGSWWVNEFKWNYEPLFSNRLISAAEGFSFHCTPAIRLANQNQTVVITWEGLQLQPKFDSVEGQIMESFGDTYDCVGFVSPVILSGLLVTFMMLFVLFIGISCMMDIKPINRFDNPKGKTITVIVDG